MHKKSLIGRYWNKFFFAEFDPAPLALFRIIFGIFLTVMFLALAPNWVKYYGPGGVRPEPAGYNGWSLFVWTQQWIPIAVYWYLGLLASIALAIGWKTRWSVVCLFIIQSSMNHADPMTINGEDLVIRLLLFCAIFAPLGQRFSIDRWLLLKKHPHSVQVFAIWPLRLMQVNIALIYAFSLPLKLAADTSWWNGEAIYWVMMTSTWNRWPIHHLFYNEILSNLITYSTVFIEGSFPILIWFKKTRIPILAAISGFHLGLAILLQHVSFFSISMICAFILFIPAKHINSMIQFFTNQLSVKYTKRIKPL